tara:strand:- start:170 stop:325 length:156 start_codon:yes stop_codon:yes gene_type:complete
LKEKNFDKVAKINIYAEFGNQKEKQKPKISLAACFEAEAGSDLDDDEQLEL